MTIELVDKSDLVYDKVNGKKNFYKDGRKCFRCGTTETYVSKTTGVAAWRRRKIISGNEKIWDGKNYYCDSCYHKLQKKCRNKDIAKDSNFGKGFRIEQAIAKTLGINNCNVELDDFNNIFDLYDPIKYKEIQVRSVEPSIRKASWKNKIYEYDVWHIALDLTECDTLMAVCMSKGYKDIERIYAIPVDKLPKDGLAKGMTLYKDHKTPAWYEEHRIDDKPFNNTYHSMEIEHCSVIRDDKD